MDGNSELISARWWRWAECSYALGPIYYYKEATQLHFNKVNIKYVELTDKKQWVNFLSF